ncbi:MAG: endonuclease, partial [Bacilli bacterium]
MRRFKKVSISLLGLLTLGSFYIYKNNNQIEQSITKVSAWSGPQTSNEGNYYTSVTGNETPSALKSKLKGLISSGTNESYDWSRYEAADEAEGDASKVLLIYSRINLSKTARVSGSVGWNREHSFAKSLFNDQAPAVNDNHHIFADDNKTNGHRGNKPFNELNPATTTRSIDSYGNVTDNYYTSAYFMPNDLAKGEVARATMYMNTRYDYSVTLNFYSVELMLEWHLENPVTNREIYRNNTVHNLQGNRNPYIDRQDWACYIYGNTNSATQSLCSASNVDPTSISVSPSNASVNLGSNLTLNATVLPLGA